MHGDTDAQVRRQIRIPAYPKAGHKGSMDTNVLPGSFVEYASSAQPPEEDPVS